MTQRSSNDIPTLDEIADLNNFASQRPRKEISDTKAQVLDNVLDLDAIHAEQAHRNLVKFIEYGWHLVEPKHPFVNNWHIEAVCEALEAVAIGQIQNLLINVPPRTSKSTISTIMFQPWCWTKWPWLRWIYASYSAELSMKHSGLAKRVMQSRWFQKNYGDKFQLINDAVKEIENDQSGYRLTTSVGGMGTGRGADIIVADDPHNVKEAHSDTKLEGVRVWWDGTMSSRAEGDVRKLRRIVIMQRVHDKDLSGHLIEKGGYVHICLPMEFNPKSRCVVPEIGFSDPREEDGQILDEKRFDRDWIDRRKGENKGGNNPELVREMDSWSYAGQYQQDPVPLEGGMAKWIWFEQSYYKERPEEIREKAHKLLASWDMSFKDDEEAKGEETSYVVCTIWAQIGPSMYLVDMRRGQWGFNETLKAFIKVCRDYPELQEKLVEDKANGPATMNTLRTKISGIIPVETGSDSKIARYGSVLWLIEGGNVRLPDPDLHTDLKWVQVALDELCRFPKASRDDIVDSATHALIRYAAMYVMDPDAFPTGVGNTNRKHETDWGHDDTYMLPDHTRTWGINRR